MNAVEIEAAITELALQPFDAAHFPYAFLLAFGNKETTIRRLQSGETNKSDLSSAHTICALLQTSNIHLATVAQGQTGAALAALRSSPATTRHKAKFILATDGDMFEAEDLTSGDTVACPFADFPNHFGFFLPLAGISTVKAIRDSSFDIRATSRLNRLYVELLKDNPDWGMPQRRQEFNHFMARLIFCFFAEDTDIFNGTGLFTQTVEQMSHSGAGQTSAAASNTHDIIRECFRAMNVPIAQRAAARLPRWADAFPYVNGGLFGDNPSGQIEVPQFSRSARSYLLHIGKLDWTQINPDIFGSMIQAVADDDERAMLGMHYTSVPNILKVLNPLFLDDLRAKLAEAGSNKAKLLNLRKRMARIRVFDPACGSGNFLVIAYKQMRQIEAAINHLRGEPERKSDIPLTNFRGIELRTFSAEIARLALIIAEYQCDVQHRGQKEALKEFLPLSNQNWIVARNALRLDWLSVCPPTGTGVKLTADDLFATPLDQTEIDFTNEGGETYICGNPPYKGSKWQDIEQKSDLSNAWQKHPKLSKTTDYISGWIAKCLDYLDAEPSAVGAFVATNSICQGQQAVDIWPVVFQRGCEIRFAHTSFKWANLASHNAGVTVVIVGLGKESNADKFLYQDDLKQQCAAISPYLVPNSLTFVEKSNTPIGEQAPMLFGNMPRDGGHLFLNAELASKIMDEEAVAIPFIKRFFGSDELISGRIRYCLWIEDDAVAAAKKIPFIAKRLLMVKENRLQSPAESTRQFSEKPHRFVQIAGTSKKHAIVVPRVSSENRPYLPVDYLTDNCIAGDSNFALYDAPLWNLALIASRLHLVWIATVCGKLETRYRSSNTIGWNTFPLPTLTEQNKADLTRCAENILLAREAHYPATIADLYDPETMPANLRAAHARNDEVLERIYIGRTFRNDTERLEKLFDLYTKMTAKAAATPARKTAARKQAST